MQLSPDQPSLLVQKIAFLYQHLDNNDWHLQQKFSQLMNICPHVQTLASSEQLKPSVVTALYHLSTQLSNLSAFPVPEGNYRSKYKYTKCVHRYRGTIKDCTISYSVNGSYAGRLRLFPRLQKLLINKPMKTFQDIQGVLSACPSLEDLSLSLTKRILLDSNDDLGRQSQLYPKMKRLKFSSHYRFNLCQLNHLLRRLNRLERLELEIFNILSVQDLLQKEFEAFLDLFHKLPYATCDMKGIRLKNPTNAVRFLQFFFQPQVLWKDTILKIASGPASSTIPRSTIHRRTIPRSTIPKSTIPTDLCYTTIKAKQRELTITFPALEENDSSIHTAYAEIFAPYVNTLKVTHGETSRKGQPSASFLNIIFTHYHVLKALYLSSGIYLDHLSTTTCNTLHLLTISNCFLTPSFLESISATCVNLRQLDISHNFWRNVNGTVSMPQTELQLLVMDIDQFHEIFHLDQQKILLKINDWYFFTYSEKRWHLVPEEIQVPEGCRLELMFKKIERLRVTYRNYRNQLVTLEYP
jgi:hypothetical protein